MVPGIPHLCPRGSGCRCDRTERVSRNKPSLGLKRWGRCSIRRWSSSQHPTLLSLMMLLLLMLMMITWTWQFGPASRPKRLGGGRHERSFCESCVRAYVRAYVRAWRVRWHAASGKFTSRDKASLGDAHGTHGIHGEADACFSVIQTNKQTNKPNSHKMVA